MLPSAVAARLRTIMNEISKYPQLKDVVGAKNEVYERYQKVFARDAIDSLSADDYRSFLYFENNRHWAGLYRRGLDAANDMDLLRSALAILLDEKKPIVERLDKLLPKGKGPMVPNLGRAVITAILHVVKPEEYAVLNGTSEAAMKELGIWPKFDRGDGFGQRYVKVNQVILDAAKQVGVDLWTLDALWWKAKSGDEQPIEEPEGEKDPGMLFGLEKYLHEFLRDNWEKTSLAKEWNLFEEDGEVVGFKYSTGEVGEIDLLAKHKNSPRWLVIELKRNQTSDDTVGQALRYMGWVKKNLAGPKEEVEGLIIAHVQDARLSYAISCVQNLRLQLYSVDFHLKETSLGS